MSKTFLQGVNEVLKQVGIIAGQLGELTSFSDTRVQHDIDVAKRAWNALLLEVYTIPESPLHKELSSSSVTLSNGGREYSLASDLVLLRWPLIDTTNRNYIYQYPGGYVQILEDQGRAGDFTGRPNYAAINEGTGKLYMDRTPTSDEDGESYTYQYDKVLTLTNLSDEMPFKDAAFDAMVMAAAQLWKKQRRSSFDEREYKRAKAIAIRIMANKPRVTSYMPEYRKPVNSTDPFRAPNS